MYKRITDIPELEPHEKQAVQMYEDVNKIQDDIEQIMQITKAQEIWKDVELYINGD